MSGAPLPDGAPMLSARGSGLLSSSSTGVMTGLVDQLQTALLEVAQKNSKVGRLEVRSSCVHVPKEMALPVLLWIMLPA